MSKPLEPGGLTAKTPALEAAILLISARLSDVHQAGLTVRQGDLGEGIHDMRVASRRLRAALGLFDAHRALRPSERRTQALQDALGRVRDVQVLQKLLRPRLPRAPATDKAVLRRALTTLSEEERKYLHQLQPLLRAWEEHAGVDLLRAVESLRLKGRLGGHRLRGKLRRRLTQVADRVAGARPFFSAESAHLLRIAAKKLRYELELLAPAFPLLASKGGRALKPLQDALGTIHDLDGALQRIADAPRVVPVLLRERSRHVRRARRALDALVPLLQEMRRAQRALALPVRR